MGFWKDKWCAINSLHTMFPSILSLPQTRMLRKPITSNVELEPRTSERPECTLEKHTMRPQGLFDELKACRIKQGPTCLEME